ncbi:MAG: Hsp70 family protein, partial [Myxococcaceae bacterium]
HQRHSMLEAGKLAGLDVLRVFNEPSAVALAFGYGKGLARKRILVYDLGGGTFDASVVEVTGDDLEVISTGGDNFLGGIDFDLRLGEDIMQRVITEQQIQPDDSVLTAQRIRDAAEQAKILLSDRETTQTQIPQAGRDENGQTVDLKLSVDRARLESITKDLVDRTLEVTQAVLSAANIQPQGLDEVLLVGGQSRAPLVRRTMESAIGRPIRTDVDAEAAVALGAAILGHALLQAERGKRGVTLAEVLSAPIGYLVQGGGMRRVLERNTRLPAEKTITLPASSGQPVAISVFQGNATLAEDNEYLGVLQLIPDKNGELAVRFAVSPDGKLEVSAAMPGGRKAEATFSTVDASEEVKASLFAQAPLPGDPSAQGAQGQGLFGGLKKLFGRK